MITTERQRAITEWNRKARAKDPERYRKLSREWAKKNPDKMRAKKLRDTARLNAVRMSLRVGQACRHCGYSTHPEILQFHHVDPSLKNRDVSKCFSELSILKEASLCVLLCPNCHALTERAKNKGINQ